ncbi:adenosylhomocysteinase AhcY [Thermacetogenium phaeum DSM 12270]|uniref:Adenosylhomocysteinase n=1 Tax=Thermacetogenium phaeum (strain ATCC BAA-254 / DSM 26808 / PB) TaxID=1089553 RepID=K4LSL5_THEPS|nr:adenosylhomocysteinase [Thermacetogenium phaeum]AFV11069.1 adenosylhomocysteinase AhcY [Thermacetogenium phaeum DSM 12270]
MGECSYLRLTDEDMGRNGAERIEWAWRKMPVLQQVRDEWERTQPLSGVKIAACLHISAKTANLARVLKAGGAEVVLCASNPLSTQDDIAAALNVVYGIPTFARRGVDHETYYHQINATLDTGPDLTIDDGADLVTTLHRERPEQARRVIGGSEETTTGVVRLRSMARDGALYYPVVAVNDAMTKHLFDNRYGTGQSSLDGILRATNYLIAGSVFVVVGYGWCGRGIAARARGLGARVIVVEVDPFKALEAVMDGHEVTNMKEAAGKADFIVTATGDVHAVGREHIPYLKDGVILSNAGHFNVEIDIPALEEQARSRRLVKKDVEEFTMQDGRRVYLLAEGRLVNLACGEGHPVEVMDMSFANQALSAAWLITQQGKLSPGVYRVPREIDERVARLKLAAYGIEIEELTAEQKEYLASWQAGT